MGDGAQKRLLSLTVVVTFGVLQIPLKKLIKETIPGRRGPGEDVAEAMIQGAARTAAVIIASTLVRALADGSGSDAKRKPQPVPCAAWRCGGALDVEAPQAAPHADVPVSLGVLRCPAWLPDQALQA